MTHGKAEVAHPTSLSHQRQLEFQRDFMKMKSEDSVNQRMAVAVKKIRFRTTTKLAVNLSPFFLLLVLPSLYSKTTHYSVRDTKFRNNFQNISISGISREHVGIYGAETMEGNLQISLFSLNSASRQNSSGTEAVSTGNTAVNQGNVLVVETVQ